MSPLASGQSVLGWSDRNSGAIELVTLNENDEIQSSFASVAGIEVHDILENSGTIALAVMANDSDIYSSKYCRSDSTPSNAVCGKMDIVLLNNLGEQTARTTLTEKTNVDDVGAQFIWWYGHTARLATDGNSFGIYFRSALSAARPSDAAEVDIHAGDTLKFVDANTGLVFDGGWDWGCSHSWSVRIANNGYNWAAVCHGDAYPNGMRIARMNAPTAPSYLSWLDNTDPSGRALGGLVPAEDGFWLNYIETKNNGLSMKLGYFEDSLDSLETIKDIAIATDMKADYPFRAYMADYGTDQLLIGWKSSEKLIIATASKNTGEIIEGPVTTDLDIDNFQEIKTTSQGDVIWAYSDGNGSSVNINRITACD